MTKSSIPLVSIWMITFNHEKYIAKAIDSVLKQKVDFNIEIVIGDDYSTDSTRKILKQYKEEHPTIIKLLLHEKNIGMVRNQNKTLDSCAGKYIAMLEGDDYWTDPTKLRKQVRAMKSNPNCDLCFHPVNTTDGRILTKYNSKTKIYPVTNCIKVGGYYCSTPSLLLKASSLRNMPPFLDDAPAGDYYLQIFGAMRGGALYLPDVMATYRVKSQGSWSEKVAQIKQKTKFLEKTLTKIIQLDNFLKHKYTNAFQYRYQRASTSLATTYLCHGHKDKYRETLEKTANYINKPILRFYIVYKLRNNPKIVILLTQLHQKYLLVKSKYQTKLHHPNIK